MQTMTEQFTSHLASQGWQIGLVLHTLPLIPTYYKDKEGNHCLVSAVHVCDYGGSNVKQGDLGCVTFCYHGKMKLKGCRSTNNRPEWFKHAFCPKSATEAIKEFNAWHQHAQAVMKTWQTII